LANGAGRAVARLAAAVVLAGSALALSATGSAQAAVAGHQQAAAKVKNYKLSGLQFYLSCMTATRCVAIGDSGSGHGTVLPISNGKQGHLTTVTASLGLYAISCPSSAGCWAIGTDAGRAPLLLKISPTGLVAQTITPSVPPHVVLDAISCVSMTVCGVAGSYQVRPSTPGSIEIGSWNGTKLSLHRVANPKGTQTAIYKISCYRSYCEAVGYANSGTSAVSGLVLTTSGGKPGKVRLTKNDAFDAVSCVSTSRCYADGNRRGGGGVIVTVTKGVASHPQTTGSTDLFGIACHGTFCTASGEVQPPKGSRFVGALITVSSGKIKGSELRVRASAGFNDVATRGSGKGFAAIGPAPKSGSVLTVG